MTHRKKYTLEFKKEASKLVLEQGYSRAEVARNLGVSVTNINRWVGASNTSMQPKKMDFVLNSDRVELEQLRKENKRLKMEREILKKAAAFFANETQ